ncbi:MAG: hypothetical protein NZU63_07710 [Gemmataceae bacterium]|nr:hypothetical protein [Gemmataceae bacterium]
MGWGLDLARRLCWATVTAAIAAGLLLTADALWHLAAWQRGLALAAWCTLMLVLLWRAGSVAFHASQREGTPLSTQRRINLAAAVASAGALVCVVIALLTWSGIHHYARRLFLPWTDASSPVPYRVVVTSGDAAVPKGERVTLTGYVECVLPDAPWPPEVWLVRQELATAGLQRLPMRVEPNGVVHLMQVADADFQYRLEVANVTSDWCRIITVEPVALTQQSCIVIEPPDYATSVKPQQRHFPISDQTELRITAWQYGTLQVRAVFSRPVATAYLEWHGDDERAIEVIPLVLDESQSTGTVRWSVTRSGRWKLVAVLERQGRRWYSAWSGVVEVVADQPPRWVQVSGLLSSPRRIAPGAVLPIHFCVQDDFGIDQAVLEYTSERKPWPANLIIPCVAQPDGSWQGSYAFYIDDRFREGDIIRLRLRVRDNRRGEPVPGGPQETIFPPHTWCELRVDRTAPPLEEQNIQVQQIWLQEAATTLRQQLNALVRTLRQVLQDNQLTQWQEHHRVLLRQAEEQFAELRLQWQAVQREVDLLVELAHLRLYCHNVQDGLDLLQRQAEQWTRWLPPAELRQNLHRCLAIFHRLDQHLVTLEKRNAYLAQARHQAWQLQRLAQRLDALARQAERMTKADENALRQAWENWQREWRTWCENTTAVRTAWDALLTQELRRVQQQSEGVIFSLQRLVRAVQTIHRQMERLVEQGCVQQIEAACVHAEYLERQRATDPRLQTCPPPRLEPWQRAVQCLLDGDRLAALTELERAALEADAQADGLARQAVQLAQKWQQLAQVLRRQRTCLAALSQTSLAMSVVVAPEERHLVNQQRRARRLADAVVQILEEGRRQGQRLTVTTDWLAAELNLLADWLSVGDGPEAALAGERAAMWLELTLAAELPVCCRQLLEQLRHELSVVRAYGQHMACSPAIALQQQRHAWRDLLLQSHHLLEEWRRVRQSAPLASALDPASIAQVLQHWQAGYENLRACVDGANNHPLHRPSVEWSPTMRPEYQTAVRSFQQAVEIATAVASSVHPLEDPAIEQCVRTLCRVQRLLTEGLPEGSGPGEWACRWRYLAQLLREAANQRLAF